MKKLLSLFLLAACISASAQPLPGAPAAKDPTRFDKGWHFGETEPLPVEDEEEPKPAPLKPIPPAAKAPEPPPSEKEKCSKKDSWTPECGFINPGTDFEFQAKQRDELMQRMSTSPNDPKAVEAFQYYMRWVLERTAEVTNVWWYNMVQNPDLDPRVTAPISAFGLRLMTDVQKGQDREVFNLIKEEGGFFVYFSRSDCKFCHDMSSALQVLKTTTGLEVRNASLDGKCMPGFEAGCMTAPATINPARALQISTVPTIFLYVPENTWLRIGTGVVDANSMSNRAVQFFLAYRSALLKGVENGQNGRPSVDFSNNQASGTAKGVEGPAGEPRPVVPSESDVARMLGAKPTR